MAKVPRGLRAVADFEYEFQMAGMNQQLNDNIETVFLMADVSLQPIASKLVKGYAITTKARLASMPELPAADEAGLKGFEVGAWHGVYAPKGTPDDIVQKLSRTLQEALPLGLAVVLAGPPSGPEVRSVVLQPAANSLKSRKR